jgi:hexosaminidase
MSAAMTSMTKFLRFALLFCLSVTTRLAAANDYLVGIPTVPFTSTGDTFNTTSITGIVVDSVLANSTDKHGWTEIPPTLGEFSQLFADDWNKLTGCSVSVKLLHGNALYAAEQDSAVLIIAVDQSLTGSVDAAGRSTSEGYTIEVSNSTGVKVTGASALGAWWGTRTLLQQAILGKGLIATGNGLDAPGWNTRGVMLDGGRHFYPIDFLKELCSWLSFWKMNTLHLHLSGKISLLSLIMSPQESFNR